MGTRPTPRAGILKARVADPQVQKMLDAIIERLEVLDGIRGDSLDKAVTYRDLGLSGFTIVGGAGGTNQIINTPGPGDGIDAPGIGPADAPTNLAANETFLAILLTWDNSTINLQHNEVVRSDVDNLSTAVLLGTTIAPLWTDYVGSNQTFFYWVRSVGTDGSVSSYNAVNGVVGTTGINPSDLLVEGSAFIVSDGGFELIAPFIVGEINGNPTIGLDGDLVIDGSIRALSIVAGSIGAREIFVVDLSAISISTGDLHVNKLSTSLDPAFRLEIEDIAGTIYPLWYGRGSKGESGRFFVRNDGTVVVKGLLKAGMIEQTFFAPSDGNDSFRIATQYDGSIGNPLYAGGEYTGKKAHLNPVLTTGFNAPETSVGTECYDRSFAPDSQHATGYESAWLTLFGPTNSSNIEYGRLGSLSENLLLRYSAHFHHSVGPPNRFWLIVKYQYDAEPIRHAFIQHYQLFGAGDRLGSIVAEDIFVTRNTAWDTLKIRIGVGCSRRDEVPGSLVRATVANTNLTVECSNFGYADQASIIDVTSPTSGALVPVRNATQIWRYF